MPTYVCRREDGTTFEVVERITDDALAEDPETGQKVVRVISGGIGLQFKGTGFYITDYARAGSGSEKTNGEAKSESRAEAKPESKSKSKSKPESTNTDASATSKD